ncbi:hypothetical protein BDF19DRAFT_454855 [Syncephalis fuscata]|nr:hypothetical protein BDF19DRAFT_454855 [Syncephalis fuscata]
MPDEEVDVLLRRMEADLSSRPITMPDDERSLDAPRAKWVVGDRIQARYKNDGKLYSARVVSVGGSDAAPVYSVVFKGYEGDAPEIVAHADTCPLLSAKTAGGDRPKKRSAPEPITGEEAEKKIKGTAARKMRQQEQRERQQSWLSFASGGKKKAVKKTGAINKKSIFATPDNGQGRVGVVGSGRPMTQFGNRNKHVYENK